MKTQEGTVRFMRDSDRLNRWATMAAMVAVAVFAAIISYTHISDLGHTYGGSVLAARLLPLCVDGMILAASLVMLADSRAGRRYGWLTWTGLGTGVGVTVAANVAYGLRYGVPGALLWSVPPVMFVLAVEIVMTRVRRTASTPQARPDTPVHTVSEGGLSLVPGSDVPSLRQIMREHRCGQSRAREIQAELA